MVGLLAGQEQQKRQTELEMAAAAAASIADQMRTVLEESVCDQCPFCGVSFQLVDGCAAMKCDSCDTAFCWICPWLQVKDEHTCPFPDAHDHLMKQHGSHFFPRKELNERHYAGRQAPIAAKQIAEIVQRNPQRFSEKGSAEAWIAGEFESILKHRGDLKILDKRQALLICNSLRANHDIWMPVLETNNRPEHLLPGRWACCMCTFVNEAMHLVCAMCENHRPREAP